MLTKLTAFLVGAFFLAGGFFIGDLLFVYKHEKPLAQDTLFYVPVGASLQKIAQAAYKNGIISNSFYFRLIGRLSGKAAKLQAGEYAVPAGTSMQDFLVLLSEGAFHYRQVTIAEGLTLEDVLSRLKAAEGLEIPEGFEAVVSDSGYREGQLLPETYAYVYGQSAGMILQRMKDAGQAFLVNAWRGRKENLPLRSKEDALILASIVEKETGIAEERPLVAAVFINRLRLGMKLQSDPTVIYGLTQGESMGRGLTKAELKQETAYNTYRIKGLPPTPIANPGKASILAALNPADVDYLYFVADGRGGHNFASDLKAHNENVRAWRALKRSETP